MQNNSALFPVVKIGFFISLHVLLVDADLVGEHARTSTRLVNPDVDDWCNRKMTSQIKGFDIPIGLITMITYLCD
jgi:hypothetical protein